MIKTGQDLVNELLSLGEEKLKQPIFIFADSDIDSIDMVDDTITDRIDINLSQGTDHKSMEIKATKLRSS